MSSHKYLIRVILIFLYLIMMYSITIQSNLELAFKVFK